MTPIRLPYAELKSALSGLGRIIPKRPSLPILGAIRIERSSDGWITLTGTALDRHVIVRLEQPAPGEPVVLILAQDDLARSFKACAGGEEITVEKRSATAAVIKYRLAQQIVETGIETFPIEEFPPCPLFDENQIAVPDSVRDSIHEAMQCASIDETRYVLNGAFVDVSKPDASYIVATDGRHLFSSNSFVLPLAESLIIPSHKFLAWKEFNSDGEWKLAVKPAGKEGTSNCFQIASRRWRYISRPIEGNYPNWRQVVPEDGSYSGVVEFPEEVESILHTIQRMPCNDEANQTIGLLFGPSSIALLGKSPGAEAWTSIGLAGMRNHSAKGNVFMSRTLLSKALRFGLRKLEIIDSSSPVRFSDGGRQMIVMPVRVEMPITTTGGNSAPSPIAATPQSLEANPSRPETSSAAAQSREAVPSESVQASRTPEKSALDMAVSHVDTLRSELRALIGNLNRLGELLRQAQRENRSSEKEIQSVRATLRSLQTVRI